MCRRTRRLVFADPNNVMGRAGRVRHFVLHPIDARTDEEHRTEGSYCSASNKESEFKTAGDFDFLCTITHVQISVPRFGGPRWTHNLTIGACPITINPRRDECEVPFEHRFSGLPPVSG